MASLVTSGGRSTLNPNAPLFIPAAVRQVEDFSPEWWQLVTTSTWFHEYWLSQQQEDDYFCASNEDDLEEDIADLLPDSIDLAAEEELLNMEQQFELFFRLTEAGTGNKSFFSTAKGATPGNGFGVDSAALMKSMNLSNHFKSPVKSAKYWEKPAKPVSPKKLNRRIQQPR